MRQSLAGQRRPKPYCSWDICPPFLSFVNGCCVSIVAFCLPTERSALISSRGVDKIKSAIALAWFSHLILLVVAFVIGCLIASRMEGSLVAFVVVTACCLSGLCVIHGTHALRNHRKNIKGWPFTLGLVIGNNFALASLYLILAALFWGESEALSGGDDDQLMAFEAFATFCTFLCLNYVAITSLLGSYHGLLLGLAPPVTRGTANI